MSALIGQLPRLARRVAQCRIRDSKRPACDCGQASGHKRPQDRLCDACKWSQAQTRMAHLERTRAPRAASPFPMSPQLRAMIAKLNREGECVEVVGGVP